MNIKMTRFKNGREGILYLFIKTQICLSKCFYSERFEMEVSHLDSECIFCTETCFLYPLTNAEKYLMKSD